MDNTARKIKCAEHEKFETERLILRKISLADAPELLDIMSDKLVIAHTGVVLKEKLEDVQMTIVNWMIPNRTIIWGLEDKANHRLIGWIELHLDGTQAELGWILNHDFWGKGLVPEAANCLSEFAFNTLDLTLLTASCEAGNRQSVRVMQKIGMKNLGCEYVVLNEKAVLSDCYAQTREDYFNEYKMKQKLNSKHRAAHSIILEAETLAHTAEINSSLNSELDTGCLNTLKVKAPANEQTEMKRISNKEIGCSAKIKCAEHEIFETSRLILRKISLEDAMALFEFTSDPEVVRYLTWEAHENIEQTKEAIVNLFILKRLRIWGIVDKKTNKLIGTIELGLKGDCGILAWALHRDYWGRGLMPEAVSCLRDFAFNELNLSVLTADHFTQNRQSGRVMEKIGMKKIGQIYIYVEKLNQSVLCDYWALEKENFYATKN